MGLFDNLFKAKPDAADEAVVEAAKRISEAEKARLLQASQTPATTPTPRTGTVPTGKPSGVPPTRAYSPRSLGQVVTPGRGGSASGKPGETKPAGIRRIKSSAAEPGSRPSEVLLLLEDVLPRIPMELVTDGPHDLKRELRFKVEDLSADIARGRAAVSLRRIAEQMPDIFAEPIAESDPRQIRLPLQKLVEQIGFLPAKPSAAAAPTPSSTSAPTPTLSPLAPPDDVPQIFQPRAAEPSTPAVEASVPPVANAAPRPAPALAPEEQPAATSLRISLRLAEVLRACPRELIVAELPPISEDERISFAWPPIEKQLESGEVEISSVRFIFALPAHLQGYFEAREGVRVPLPLAEIYRNMPDRAAPADVPAKPQAESPGAEPQEKIEVSHAEAPPAPPEKAPQFVELAPEPAAPSELCIEASSPAELPPAPAPLVEGGFEIPEQLFVRKTEPLPEPVFASPAAEAPEPEPPAPIIEADASAESIPDVIFARATVPAATEEIAAPIGEIVLEAKDVAPAIAPEPEGGEADAGASAAQEEKEEHHLELAPPVMLHVPPPIAPLHPQEEAPPASPVAPAVDELVPQPVHEEEPVAAAVAEPAAAPSPPPIFVPPPLRQEGEVLAPEIPEQPIEPAAGDEPQITPPNVWMQPPPELGGRPAATPWPPDVAPPPSPMLPVRVVAPPVLRPMVAPPPLFGAGAGDVVPGAEAMPPQPVAPEPAPPPPPPPPEPLRLEAASLAAGLSEADTLAGIGNELIRLPGMVACVLSARHETAHSGELPAGFEPEGALALARQFSTALDSSAEKLGAGHVQHFTIFGDAHCLSFFAQGSAVVCAIHRTRAPLPGVREKFSAVIAALAEA